MSVRRSASGVGEMPLCFQLLENETIDRRAHPVAVAHGRRIVLPHGLKRPPIAAGAAAVVVWKASIGSVPQPAPVAIHVRSTAFSLSGNGVFGGISSDKTRSQSKLSSGLPGTITLPLSPPASAAAAARQVELALGLGTRVTVQAPPGEQRGNGGIEVDRVCASGCIPAGQEQRKRGQSVSDRHPHRVGARGAGGIKATSRYYTFTNRRPHDLVGAGLRPRPPVRPKVSETCARLREPGGRTLLRCVVHFPRLSLMESSGAKPRSALAVKSPSRSR